MSLFHIRSTTPTCVVLLFTLINRSISILYALDNLFPSTKLKKGKYMARASILACLRIMMILICIGWISLWILKPTDLWTRKWKEAEDKVRSTAFGYYGLNFVVFTFPMITVAIVGCVYLNYQAKGVERRQPKTAFAALTNPVIVKGLLGTLSVLEIVAISLFVLFLAWTFYARISNDFKKLEPIKNLKLKMWQLKYLRVATRFGLLAEASLALLLFPVLRVMPLFRILGIQFEASVRYHTWLGTAMILFATIHGASTLFIWGVSHHIQDEMGQWQRTGRIYLAGEITLVTGLVIWITSLPFIRRRRFEIFYYTHHLYIIFLLFFLLHSGDRHFYTVFPGIFLFGIDKLLRIVQSRPGPCILSARVFPCKAVELTLPKDPRLMYSPSSVIFLKIPKISKLQWHPFSIISSSSIDNETMSVIIKCEGKWTGALYQMIHGQLDSKADHTKCIQVATEGPYGPPSVNFLRYDSLLLVAGGIGITPFLSIIQEIASVQSSSKYKFPARLQLIYAIKHSQEICLLNSISHALCNPMGEKLNLKLKVYVTQENQSSSTSMVLQEGLSQGHVIHFDTKCSNYAVQEQETFFGLAILAGIASVLFLSLLVCFNHIFIPSEKKPVKHKGLKGSEAKTKTPSSVVDIILLSCFVISIISTTILAVISRWRRLRKEIPPVSPKKAGNVADPGSFGTIDALQEHEVRFGGRPNFQDIFSKFPNETSGSDVGVLVCGPESMKESVAALCNNICTGYPDKGRARFTFHSLNFTL